MPKFIQSVRHKTTDMLSPGHTVLSLPSYLIRAQSLSIPLHRPTTVLLSFLVIVSLLPCKMVYARVPFAIIKCPNNLAFLLTQHVIQLCAPQPVQSAALLSISTLNVGLCVMSPCNAPATVFCRNCLKKRKDRGQGGRMLWTDMKMVGLERKMADDRRRWRRTIDDHWWWDKTEVLPQTQERTM